ncbi:hypothetical protein [Actinomadura sp. 21ATH]|uniref:hypothetical protein n=1 Tax=Actinomadura sp. 21ATH TaxID=1735444 RepID=UPI0035C1C2D9
MSETVREALQAVGLLAFLAVVVAGAAALDTWMGRRRTRGPGPRRADGRRGPRSRHIARHPAVPDEDTPERQV